MCSESKFWGADLQLVDGKAKERRESHFAVATRPIAVGREGGQESA